MSDRGRLCKELAQDLLLMALDELPPERWALLQAHLSDCERCRAELRETRRVLGVYRESGGSESDDKLMVLAPSVPTPRNRHGFLKVAVAASVALVAGSMAGWLAHGVVAFSPVVAPQGPPAHQQAPLEAATRSYESPDPLYRWVEQLPVGDLPPARQGAIGAWNPEARELLVFGGYTGSSRQPHLSDTWAYLADTDQWERRADGPAPITGATAVWDRRNERMLVFGGSLPFGEPSPSLYAYDPRSDAWVELQPIGDRPPGGDDGAAAWDDDAGCMYIFGAQVAGSPQGDLWRYCVASQGWERLSPSGELPTARASATLVYDAEESRLILFGGRADGTFFNDVFTYSTAENSWRKVPATSGPWPVARGAHVALWDAEARQMLVIGGGDAIDRLDDVWAFHPSSDTWSQLGYINIGPMPLVDMVGMRDDLTGAGYLFGGLDAERQRSNRIWRFESVRPDSSIPPASGVGRNDPRR